MLGEEERQKFVLVVVVHEVSRACLLLQSKLSHGVVKFYICITAKIAEIVFS